MKPLTQPGFFPCAIFFDEGRPVMGCVTLLLQASLIFWPMASRLAREATERTGIEKLLNELSDANRAPEDYRYTAKKFHQAA
jgi:hypothetical protein